MHTSVRRLTHESTLTPIHTHAQIVYVDIGEENEKDDKKKMYEKDDANPRTFKSKRTGRGMLRDGWQVSFSLSLSTP